MSTFTYSLNVRTFRFGNYDKSSIHESYHLSYNAYAQKETSTVVGYSLFFFCTEPMNETLQRRNGFSVTKSAFVEILDTLYC